MEAVLDLNNWVSLPTNYNVHVTASTAIALQVLCILSGPDSEECVIGYDGQGVHEEG